MSDAEQTLGFNQVTILAIEGLGVGTLAQDADGLDRGADTLGNVATYVGGLELPYLQWMGLGNLRTARGLAPSEPPAASVARLAPMSSGGDPAAALRGLVSGVLPGLIEAGVQVIAYGELTDALGDDEVTKRDTEVRDEALFDKLRRALQRSRRSLVIGTVSTRASTAGPVAVSRVLSMIDTEVAPLLDFLTEGHLLLIVGLNGRDPTVSATSTPTLEWLPLLAYTPLVPSGVDLGARGGLADIGATLADAFGIEGGHGGVSFFGPMLA